MKQLHIQYKNVDKNYKKKLVLFLARQVHFFLTEKNESASCIKSVLSKSFEKSRKNEKIKLR